jgi:putative FmdB family regulatory protein
MPTYEYRCTDCGNRVEVFQRIGDAHLTICEICGGTMRKVFLPAGIVFKGSGFYATDSRKAKAGSRDGKGSSDKGSGEKAPSEKKSGKGGSSEGGSSEGGSSKPAPSGGGSKEKTS